MKNFQQLKSEIIDSTLIQIYRTVKPISEFWFEGLGNLLTYNYIAEFDNGNKYDFFEDHLCHWDGESKIIELESEFSNEYKNKKIIDVISDPEYESIYFRTENDMVIHHSTFFGSKLDYEKYSEVFDEDGKLI